VSTADKCQERRHAAEVTLGTFEKCQKLFRESTASRPSATIVCATNGPNVRINPTGQFQFSSQTAEPTPTATGQGKPRSPFQAGITRMPTTYLYGQNKTLGLRQFHAFHSYNSVSGISSHPSPPNFFRPGNANLQFSDRTKTSSSCIPKCRLWAHSRK